MGKADPYVAVGPGGKDDLKKLKVDELGHLVTNASGEFSSSGLKKAIRTCKITITDEATKIPVTPLTDRNTISVRVMGTAWVYFGKATVSVEGDVDGEDAGYPKMQFEEMSVDIKDNPAVEMYAICEAGKSCVVRVIELA